MAPRRGTGAPVSASATGRPPRWSRSPRTSRSSAPRRRSRQTPCSGCSRAVSPPRHRRRRFRRRATRPLRLLRRVGVADPASIDDYRADGGYAALRRAIELGPEGVLREVKDSKLVGRGGAAFPTGVKWEAVARQPVRPHYLDLQRRRVRARDLQGSRAARGRPVRGDRGDDDRRLRDGVRRGYVYLRGEYPEARHALEHALAQARDRGFLGEDVMGEGFSFDIEVRRGAGAYICGEETAIFESIEGKRGEPRNKPPFPVEVGLFGKPTVVNNVETLVNVLDVVLELRSGVRARSAPRARPGRSSSASPGTSRGRGRTRSRSERPCARCSTWPAGCRPDGALQAVLIGGAAGGFLGPDDLDVPLTFEGDARGGDDARLGRRARARRHGRPAAAADADRRVLPRRVVRPVRPVPRRHGAPGGGARAAARRRAARRRRAGARAHRRGRPVHARRIDLRARADGLERGRVRDPPAPRLPGGGRVSELLAPTRMVELEVDGQPVRVFEGSTILDACRQLGIDTPDPLLRRDARAGECLPRLRRRARGLARARPRVLAEGRGRDEGADGLRARAALAAGS